MAIEGTELLTNHMGYKMKKVFVVLLLLLSSQLFAQEKSFQVGIGLNQSWLIYDLTAINDFKPDFRPKLNLFLNYNVAKFGNFKTSAGIRYFNLGRAITLDYGNSRITAKIDHHLISVPIQLKYGLDFINTNLIINAEPSYILRSTSISPSIYDDGLMTERTTTDEMQRLQFSVGLGAEYIFSINNETFSFKTIYNYGLTKIPKEERFRLSDGTVFFYTPYKATELNVSLSYYF